MRHPYGVLDDAFEEHRPVACWALFSGGHDSLTATSLANEWAKTRGIEMRTAHINTGTGIPQTTEFVHEVCAEQGWTLKEFHPPLPYEKIVLELAGGIGFPGPPQHGLFYQRLKERCLEQMIREAKQKHRDRVMFVTGVRAEESVRRMRHVDRIQQQGVRIWAAAIWNWSKLDCNHYIERAGLRRNPVVDLLHMSGECLCGAFARPGELREIAQWFPEVAARILELQERVEATGHPACRWGQPPPNVHREQEALFERSVGETPMLCQGCEQRAA